MPFSDYHKGDAICNAEFFCLFGLQVGDAKYTINLENALSQDRMDRRFAFNIVVVFAYTLLSTAYICRND